MRKFYVVRGHRVTLGGVVHTDGVELPSGRDYDALIQLGEVREEIHHEQYHSQAEGMIRDEKRRDKRDRPRREKAQEDSQEGKK